MFKKILIANRGEIAVRVIRACRELDISPVAVYSEADAAALHVRLADEAYLLGPAPSVESYLRIERVVEAARLSGAEAIHPGYGFLAENAGFARAVAAAGLVFIGPSPEAMELMGSKTSARRAATAAGAPVVPGTNEALASVEDARATALSVGYPVMLKAAAGGGGKGMRLVASEDEMASAFETARSEAASAFGDSSVYIEKAVERPRHIEIQIFADAQGNFVHLGERECSIQRRHQKVIEECPSPIDDADLRETMGAAAIRIARAAGYIGAGTVEFLVSDVTREFYFLEMNTRLQVEHPVTELVTGFDLVREQIRVAYGLPLSFTQADVHWTGHAVECRVYAEDPEQNFMPSPGRIAVLRVPAGPGVRDDSGVYEGAEVSIYYDPLVSKLAAWGRTRAEAIERMRRALSEYTVGGIKTTLPFFREVMRDPEFVAGRLDTGFITRFNERRRAAEAARAAEPTADEIIRRDMATIAAALAYRESEQRGSQQPPLQAAPSRWKMAGRAAQLQSKI
ncbi:MAG TPA: acetyl-CoA carboxylase biotin carboxylase subunit [Pyrinomonadaceae bacterium]|jgi:acetyl-CoA carboxylase biotin carboxylase subunit|nr:acetyl-CoA carboxylase biotin carboxylase subunit [Pyrinomonadaceae bacterium]